MKITNEFENKIIGRREVKGSLRAGESDVTMTRAALRAALAKKYKSKDECIVISKIAPHFGDSAVTFSANIYEKEDVKNTYELAHMVKRNTVEKPEAAEEETQAEAPKTEEAPVEEAAKVEAEAKEEASAEEKKEEAKE